MIEGKKQDLIYCPVASVNTPELAMHEYSGDNVQIQVRVQRIKTTVEKL